MSDVVQVALIAAVPSIVASLFSYLGLRQSKRNGHQMNSRMDQMLKLEGAASESRGRDQERQRQANKE